MEGRKRQEAHASASGVFGVNERAPTVCFRDVMDVVMHFMVPKVLLDSQ